MSMNQMRHDPSQQLRQFIDLIDKKCKELPKDIDYWQEMASKHNPDSRTYKNIVESSLEPREIYLSTLKKLHISLMEALDIIDGTEMLSPPDVSLEAPVETIIRTCLDLFKKLKDAAENNQSFVQFFNGLLDRINYIRSDLNQTILRCSAGDINYKDIEYYVRSLEPILEENLDQHISNKKNCLNVISEKLIQKIEMDVAVRKSIQDRQVMHSTLQVYLDHIESNPDFSELLPTLQYKIRQIISQPLDSIVSKQQQEVDVAVYELQQILEPIQGKTTVNVPDSVTSVHQLIQQAVEQQEEVSRLKVNVMGAFKHLVQQIDQMFQFQPFTPVQAASVLGAAWMQHPLTSSQNVREFRGQLDSVKKSDSYQRLMACFGNESIDASFKFVDEKVSEIANQLEINERIEAMKEMNQSPALINATDFCVKTNEIDPVKIRREIIHRAGYLTSIKTYIQQLCDSVKAHLYLVYYEHSLSPENVNLNNRVNHVLNQISKEYYDRKNCDESIDRNVFMTSVRQVFEEICDTEIQMNMEIFSLRKRIKTLIQTLKETNKYARKDIRKKILNEKNELKRQLIKANVPRLKGFIDVLSSKEYEGVHMESVEQIEPLKLKLRSLIQQKVALEQVVAL